MHPFREPAYPPPPPRSRRTARAAVAAFAALALVVAWFAFRKRVDPRWTRLDVGDRSVHSLATSPDGRLFVAADLHDASELLVSSDRGLTFRSSRLRTPTLWRVTWLPRAQRVCAGGRSGLFCGDGDQMPLVLRGVDTYFAIETASGLLTGGHPQLFVGDIDGRSFEPATRVSYAVSDAVVTGDRVLRGGDGLYASDDDGRHDARLGDVDFNVRVLAASGPRVYAAGGTFGGSFARSDDGGRHWSELPFPGSQPEVIVVLSGNPDVIFVGTHGDVRRGDVLRSLDGGHSWRGLGCPGAEVHALAIDEQFVYCGATAMLGAHGLWRMRLEDALSAHQ